jgi:hypothetical protein
LQSRSGTRRIDVRGQHFVAVPAASAGGLHQSDVTPEGVRSSAAYGRLGRVVADRRATVAMESTGVYWIPLYELSRPGLRILVDPRQTKHAPGRPKSDVLDCQWIRRLHSYGLLTASFRPADEIVVWRGFQRQRDMLVRYAAQHVQHLQKALEEMNVKLTEVVSDIVGQTGLKIIKDIVRGVLIRSVGEASRSARRRKRNCRSVVRQQRKEHLFALEQALKLYEF